MQARQGSGRMVAGLAPVVAAVLVLISAIIDLYCVLQRCVSAAPVDVSRGDPLEVSSSPIRADERRREPPKWIVCILPGQTSVYEHVTPQLVTVRARAGRAIRSASLRFFW